MHHAAAQHFEPARFAAVAAIPGDVDFGRGLGEGEVAGAEAHREIAFEKRIDELLQRALEVGEAGGFVHQQAFDLVEHRRVGLVAVAAVDLARRDDADRRLAAGHRTDLHRRGVGAQQATITEVEGIVHRTRGVVRREVQRLEIVPVVLDLGTIGHLVAEAREDRSDALQRARDRVQVAALGIAPRQGDVDAFGRETLRQCGLFELGLARGERGRERVADAVDAFAVDLALVRRELAEAFQLLGDAAGLAEQADADGIEAIERGGGGDVGEAGIGEGLQIAHSILPV